MFTTYDRYYLKSAHEAVKFHQEQAHTYQELHTSKGHRFSLLLSATALVYRPQSHLHITLHQG